jgi:septum site-determining protein MinC
MLKENTAREMRIFEIKSTDLPMVALMIRTTDLQKLNMEFNARFSDMPGFFDEDGIVIDLSGIQSSFQSESKSAFETALEFEALNSMLRSHKLRPVAVRGGSEQQTAAAIESGLLHTPSLHPGTKNNRAPDQGGSLVMRHLPEIEALAGALIIDKQLRCGQQVYARGRDLVVMAMVNPGAEVIADGHIHIYAPLRGKAIAGAKGDSNARIFALNMSPELISIAGVYCTGDASLPRSVLGQSAQISLISDDDGGKLVANKISQKMQS